MALSTRLDFRDSEIFALLKDLQVETLLYGMARAEHEETRRIISHFNYPSPADALSTERP